MWVVVQRHAPATLHPRKKPGTHFIGGWVGPRTGLDGCGKYRPQRDSIHGSSILKRVAIPTELSRSAVFSIYKKVKQSRYRPGVAQTVPES
jgi:hypothetical protein